ncbi:hypothetical protein [Paracoccus sp. PAR01]|uniref:hypothetical protein n=1 Tax=Paracoccus sp. PAR01 TaxID=2769282 RepID=UPI00177C1CE6|nr:hypothetical protein [Paracoccus sp. PAR01]MBD9528669.1 hypothetical protein [Paracoccus sp. PAR01]
MNGPHWTDQFLVIAALVWAWLTGEAWRASVAGAAGGFVRWLMSERRRIREFFVSVVAGWLMATYAAPLMLAMIESHFGPLKGDASGTAGFAAGIAGMSIAKLILDMIEARTRRITGGGQSDA